MTSDHGGAEHSSWCRPPSSFPIRSTTPCAAPRIGRPGLHPTAAGVAPTGKQSCYQRCVVLLAAVLQTTAGIASDGGWHSSRQRAVLLHKVAGVATHGNQRCSQRGAALLHKVPELLSTGSGVATQGGMCCSRRGVVLLQRSTSELQALPRVLQIPTAGATTADASAAVETASTYSREAPQMLQDHGGAANLFHCRRCDSGGAVFSGDTVSRYTVFLRRRGRCWCCGGVPSRGMVGGWRLGMEDFFCVIK
jgi:hypothetical protein